jgi:hypothetical protein
MMQAHDLLKGRLILVATGNAFLRGYIEAGLSRVGAQILGPARLAGEVNDLIGRLRTYPDAAVIDLDLFEAENPIAESIRNLRIPLLLVSNSGRSPCAKSREYPTLATPFAAFQVVDHLRSVLDPPQPFIDHPSGPSLRGH